MIIRKSQALKILFNILVMVYNKFCVGAWECACGKMSGWYGL